MREFLFAIAMISSIVCFALLGYSRGHFDGTDMACKSIGLEWVNDKCMKVTREAV